MAAPVRRSLAALALALAAGALLVPACSRKHEILAPEAPPVCDVTPTTLDFGLQALGVPGDTLSFTVTNRGGGILAARIGGVCAPFQVTCGCGNLNLKANESQTVSLRFVPTGLGPATCTWSFGDSGLCAGVTCTGTGIRPPACRLSPASLSFGGAEVGTCTAEQSFTITNAGDAPLSGTVPDSAGPFRVVAGAGPYALATGETRRVAVRFCPTREGSAGADLSVGACAVPCAGSGYLPPPLCNVSVTELEFGTLPVGTCGERTFRITNVGPGIVTGTVPASCGPFQVVDGSGPFSLESGGVRPVTVRFCPTSATRSDCQLSLGLSCAPVHCTGSGTCHASLIVLSNPASATILLDNVAQTCVTPCTLTVSAGPHTLLLRKKGYQRFDGPSSVTMPCVGTVTAEYVGHHVTRYTVDAATWLDESAPTANHCTDSVLVVGRAATGDSSVALLYCMGLASDLRMSVYQATLILYRKSCPAGTGQTIVARPAATSWTSCASTWSAPGTSWEAGGPEASLYVDCDLRASGYFRIDTTPIVSRWLDGSLPNTGWVLLPGPASVPTVQVFVSPRDPYSGAYVEVDWFDR